MRERAAVAAGQWYKVKFRGGLPDLAATPVSPAGRFLQEGRFDEEEIFSPANAKILTAEAGRVIGYQFDLPRGGCMVISAYDELAPVLFYSKVNGFDPEAVPSAKALWEDYCQRAGEMVDGAATNGTTHALWEVLEQTAIKGWGVTFSIEERSVDADGLASTRTLQQPMPHIF
ncbi:MAG: hypothetical protein ACYTF1_21490 [Planctomycetota bacterium]